MLKLISHLVIFLNTFPCFLSPLPGFLTSLQVSLVAGTNVTFGIHEQTSTHDGSRHFNFIHRGCMFYFLGAHVSSERGIWDTRKQFNIELRCNRKSSCVVFGPCARRSCQCGLLYSSLGQMKDVCVTLVRRPQTCL